MSTACCRCRFSGADCRQPVLARLTARRTVRSLIIMGGWPIMFGLILSAAATVVSSHAYLWMTAGLSFYAFGIGLANAGFGAFNPVRQRDE